MRSHLSDFNFFISKKAVKVKNIKKNIKTMVTTHENMSTVKVS